MIHIDAMGLECPQPVIKAKQVIKDSAKKEDIVVFVDNDVATQNLSRLGAQEGAQVVVESVEKNKFAVKFMFGSCSSCAPKSNDFSSSEYVVAIGSDKVGTGEDELGLKLAESFIYALTEQDIKPKFVICYNSGVFLTTKNEKTIADMKKLEESGCEIVSCGLCLDYYKLKEELKVGSITNMYRIVEILRTNRVVHP